MAYCVWLTLNNQFLTSGKVYTVNNSSLSTESCLTPYSQMILDDCFCSTQTDTESDCRDVKIPHDSPISCHLCCCSNSMRNVNDYSRSGRSLMLSTEVKFGAVQSSSSGISVYFLHSTCRRDCCVLVALLRWWYDFKLLPLRQVQCSLTSNAVKTLVHAFISSRLDYCNILLTGVGDGVLRKVQSVQNAVARLITNTKKFDHITSVLRDIGFRSASELFSKRPCWFTGVCMFWRRHTWPSAVDLYPLCQVDDSCSLVLQASSCSKNNGRRVAAKVSQ